MMDSYMAAKQITSVYAAVLTPRLVDDSVGFLRQGVGGGDVPIEEAMAGENGSASPVRSNGEPVENSGLGI